MSKQRRIPPAVPPRPAPAGERDTAAAAELRKLIEQAEQARAALAEQVREARETRKDMAPLLTQTRKWMEGELYRQAQKAFNEACDESVRLISEQATRVVATFNARADQQAELLAGARDQIADLAGLGDRKKLMEWLAGNLAGTLRELSVDFIAQTVLNPEMSDEDRERGTAMFLGLSRAVAEGGVSRLLINPTTGRIRKDRQQMPEPGPGR